MIGIKDTHPEAMKRRGDYLGKTVQVLQTCRKICYLYKADPFRLYLMLQMPFKIGLKGYLKYLWMRRVKSLMSALSR